MRYHFYLLTIIILSLSSATSNGQTNGPVVIPVVFHILHNHNTDSISQAQVLNALDILNRDYNKQNADTANVIQAYQNNIANMGITFRLARIDPNGNCTNGIEYIHSVMADSGGTAGAYVGSWPHDKYFNIWTFNRIGGLAGFAISPWLADTRSTLDGVSVANSYLGSIGTGSLFTSRSLTYLVGEYLGLVQMAGVDSVQQNCENTDSVADTPTGHYTGGNTNCSAITMSCDTPLLENLQNYMLGSTCSCMFTNGQRDRVYTYLNRSQRSMWQTANLVATGTLDTSSVTCLASGIRDVPESRYAVFPNPFTSSITINGVNNGSYSVSILDVTGRVLRVFHDISADRNGSATIDLSNLATAGIYFARIYDSTTTTTEKIVKQ